MTPAALIEIPSADVRYDNGLSDFPSASDSAILRDNTVPSPPVVKAMNRKNTDRQIWYSPKTSAPTSRERYILKTNDSVLVITLIPVTVATDFTIDTLYCM